MKQHSEPKVSVLAKTCIVSALVLVLFAPSLLQAQRLHIDDFEVGLKSNTPPIVVSVGVTATSDPAGHSCCVTAVPSLIEVFLVEGDLVLREAANGNAVPWLDFDTMRVDSNQSFVGESRATVAGFSNILTVLSGNITSEGIVGTFNIGAGGGLPGGLPISFDFTTFGDLGFAVEYRSVLALQASVGLGFEIVDIPEDEERPVDLYLVLQDELNAPEADWWLLTLSGGEIRSFDLETLTFQPGLRPTLQGPTTSIPEPVRLSAFPGDEAEGITVFFGVDTRQNGILDEGELFGVGYTYF